MRLKSQRAIIPRLLLHSSRRIGALSLSVCHFSLRLRCFQCYKTEAILPALLTEGTIWLRLDVASRMRSEHKAVVVASKLSLR